MVTTLVLSLLLAVACVLEIDFGASKLDAQGVRECEVMWAIHDARALDSGRSLEDEIRGYVSGFVCEGRRCDTPRMAMIRGMNTAGSEPEGWDTARAGSWNKHYRWRWMRRLDAARRFLARREARDEGNAPAALLFPQSSRASCRAARYYGGACAVTGACDKVPACWQLADCGPTQQAYWIPRDTCAHPGGVIDAKTAAARR